MDGHLAVIFLHRVLNAFHTEPVEIFIFFRCNGNGIHHFQPVLKIVLKLEQRQPASFPHTYGDHPLILILQALHRFNGIVHGVAENRKKIGGIHPCSESITGKLKATALGIKQTTP